ncbi:glycoside hydrolase family 97 protein [Alkaliflexus imshenetskii]|uniref:glycoside hydrolase family 97 protein n=1 Tax=Alkaliflexus imshenetskii TaxID=286730 RepID=UPI00047952B9|nr:glycoside hydrolase family 97 protein [Alkaliflexus imshenetskii]
MKKIVLSLLFSMFAQVWLQAEEHRVQSPSGIIEIRVNVADRLTWSLFLNGDLVMGPSDISLSVQNEGVLGRNTRVRRVTRQSINQVIQTPVYRKSSVVNHYNQMTLALRDGLGVVFRVYDDGVAYQLNTSFKKEIHILDEEANLVFPASEKAWVPYIVPRPFDPFSTSFESTYDVLKLDDIVADSLIIMPLLIELGNNRKAVITEVDLEEFPGMFLTINNQRNGFRGRFAPYPLEEVRGGHNNLQSIVTQRADYIAKTKGTRSYPWRAIAISQNDVELLDNDLVARLAAPNRIGDVSWIKPGKVAWDWWNDLNITGVDFRSGVNTETYKYYVDFAADNGVEYVILDEGWSEQESLLQIKPYIDLEGIITHAKNRGVGIILWAGWLPLNEEMDKVMALYSKMGVAGYKIDFMDRDDQPTVEFYYRVARKAAQYKQLVNFHGAYKPTGLQFTYPNVITFEGVYGLENVKWTDYLDMPLYDVTIPFIRALAGPMDYTPGAMINANRWNWRAVHSTPMSQGTRCHQLAMYVVFESPLSMMADNPTHYKREPESTAFIASIPTVFNQTVALSGKLGEYVAIARRNGADWYVGAMTSWESREIEIDFSFLKDGRYEAEIFRDGINADRNGNDYKRKVVEVTSDTRIKVYMAPGGGWAARLVPVK